MSTIASRVCPSATAVARAIDAVAVRPAMAERADRTLEAGEVGKLGARGSHAAGDAAHLRRRPSGVGSTCCVLTLPHGTRATSAGLRQMGGVSGPERLDAGGRPRRKERRNRPKGWTASADVV